MKKTCIIATLLIGLMGFAMAESWQTHDMADYGTTASITNTLATPATLTYAIVTYDAITTNTLSMFVSRGGIDYRLGTVTTTSNQYDVIDLIDYEHRTGGILTITTTDTNVNVIVRQE